MNVVIRPEDGQPDSLKALLAELGEVAGDEPVRLESGGVAVSRDVARKFLSRKASPDAPETTGHTVDNTREPMETRPLVPDPDADPEPTPPPAKKANPPAAKKATPAKKTTAAAQQRASRSTRSNP